VHAREVGARLLLAAGVLEALRVALTSWLPPSAPLWLWLPGLLGCALLAVRVFVGIPLSAIGLRPWREWTATEKSYFCQVLVLANVVFPLVLAGPIRNRLAQPGVAWSLGNVVVPYLFFGFYQEVVYRGMVQSELVRRWGAAPGILVANLLYTFGPLHLSTFRAAASTARPMFAGIFAIGLVFGILFRRSGNLWMVAVFHAIGNAYILWSVGGS
jgi:membrane protease YdiL (CAAX protease family)